MSRPIDHVVLPCPDLAAAAARFERLGFQVGVRNRHPWGTENHVIQFPGAFLELIALAPDYRPLPSHDDAFPFAGFLAGHAGSQDPSGMVVLRSDDAARDAEAFAAAGIGSRRMLHFSRAAEAPDGTVRTVAFDLAFADAPSMPDLGFFVCQQLRPENFWNPACQRHSNGVTGLRGLLISAETPSAHAPFLAAFTGEQAASFTDRPPASRHRIELITPAAARLRFGDTLPGRSTAPSASPCLAVLCFETSDLATTIHSIEGEGRRSVASPHGWIVASGTWSGPALVFESPTAR